MKVLIVDDHGLFRDGLRAMLSRETRDAEILEAATIEIAREVVARNADLDVVLLDLALPGVEGFSGLQALKDMDPDLPVAVISGTNDLRLARRAVNEGAGGYILKEDTNAEIVAAVRSVIQGDIALSPRLTPAEAHTPPTDAAMMERLNQLTPRQRDILSQLRRGRSNKEIALDLGLSETTVKVHVTAVLKTLHLDNRTQAALLAEQIGL